MSTFHRTKTGDVSPAKLCTFLLESPVGMFLRELEGSPLLLACQLGQSGDLKWVKDNRVAVPSYFGLLWKPRLEQSDEGEYTCSLNKSSFNYYLVVQGG